MTTTNVNTDQTTAVKKLGLKEFLEHITNSNPFDSDSFIFSRNLNNHSEDGEYQLWATYVHGAAYIEGHVGSEGFKIKLFYNNLQGFQLWTHFGKDVRVDSWPPHQSDSVFKEITHLAKL